MLSNINTRPRLPPEIICIISKLTVSGYPDGGMLSLADKQSLSRCSLTCREWATLLRPLLFQHLSLRSKEDVDTLIALPSFLTRLLTRLVVVLGPLLPKKPWLHNVRQLAKLHGAATIHLNITFDSPSQQPTYTPYGFVEPPKNHAYMRHTILDTLPPLIPARTLRFAHLFFYGIHLVDISIISNLITQMPTVQSCGCQSVIFTKLYPTLRNLHRRKSLQRLEVTSIGCVVTGTFQRGSDGDLAEMIPRSILVSSLCFAADMDFLERTTSLLSRLCSSCRYDHTKISFRSTDNMHRANNQWWAYEISLEILFGVPHPAGAAPSVTAALLTFGQLKKIAGIHLNWSDFMDGLDEIFSSTLVIQTSDADLKGYLLFSSDKRVQRLQELIKSGSARIVDDETYQDTVDYAYAHLRAEASNVALPASFYITAQLKNIRSSDNKTYTPRSSSYHFPTDYSTPVQEELPGIVVPQQVYRPPAGHPEYKCLPSIPFNHNGFPGIRLADALLLPIPNLHCAQSRPSLSEFGTRVALRIMWPGHGPWSHQNATDIFDHTLQANPATLELIAQRIATILRGFCEEKSRERSREPGWQLRHDSFEKLYLFELRHVSKGSWQPVICLDIERVDESCHGIHHKLAKHVPQEFYPRLPPSLSAMFLGDWNEFLPRQDEARLEAQLGSRSCWDRERVDVSRNGLHHDLAEHGLQQPRPRLPPFDGRAVDVEADVKNIVEPGQRRQVPSPTNQRDRDRFSFMANRASYHFSTDFSPAVQVQLSGVVVPQQVYRPPAGQPEYNCLPNIPFKHNGFPGIRLADALRLPIPDLHRAQSRPALSETGTRVALRIMWPGYGPWSHQNAIDIFDHTLQANPATLGLIAQRIATLFLGYCEEKSREWSREPGWQLYHDSFEKLYLVELRHVSKGSWQPVICWASA